MELTDIKGLGKVSLEKLNQLGIYCVKDLSLYMPIFYRDYSCTDNDTEFFVGKTVLLDAELAELKEKKNRYKIIIDSTFIINNKLIKVIWFNQAYLSKILKLGKKYRLYGKIDKDYRLINPKLEELDKLTELTGVKAFYKTCEGLSQNKLRQFIKVAVDAVGENDIVSSTANIDFKKLLYDIHYPKNILDGQNAIENYRKLFLAKLLVSYKLSHTKFSSAKKYIYSKNMYNYVEKRIKFTLNDSQKSAIKDICNDFKNGITRRLLQGDVGSGKSIVAYIAAYINAQNGYQTVIVAPTEILAVQHYNKLNEIFEDSEISICLLTSRTKNNTILSSIKAHKVDIIVGTQAVLSAGVEYDNLSLAIIDEQHRFGVTERAILEMKYECGVLLLTATPIPRTLMLTFLNDLKCSYLARREDQKATPETYVVPENKTTDMWQYIYSFMQNNEQVFIVCPRITDEDGICIYSAEKLFDELSKGVYKNLSLALLHGKMTSQEKIDTMQNFRNKKISVLISTTVIEVGIDIPNATIIVVMNAERYGLATLHQLRGRVGRGDIRGKCFLHTAVSDEKSLDRLIKFSKIIDGNKLAEYDFTNRGAGDIFGKRQSGRSENLITLTNLEYANNLASILLANEQSITDFKKNILPYFVEKVEDITLN